MSNIFDALQDAAFNIVTNTMGYTASWTPSSGNPLIANVLFKDATQSAKLLDQIFDPKFCIAEYKYGDFTGLKEAADRGNEEIIIINGITYGVLKVESDYDGKTLKAHLKLL